MGSDLAVLLGKLCIQRRDVKAEQHADGHYEPVHSKITMGDLRAHLAGEKTYGHYLLSPEGDTRLFCFDIDLNPAGVGMTDDGEVPIRPQEEWLKPDSEFRDELTVELRCLAEGLAARVKRMLEIPVAISYSGHKGLHVYGFAAAANGHEGMPATDVRAAGIGILEEWGVFEVVKGKSFYRHSYLYPNLTIEVFPKQTAIQPDGFGNLLRLPLGVHRKTGQAGFFVDVTLPHRQLGPADPVASLEGGDPWMGAQ